MLHYGSVPRVDLATWDFRVWGEVENPFSFTWAEFKQMPRKSLHTDIHCVTRWSRLDMDFEGVPIQHILERAGLKPSAHFVRRPRRAGLHRQPAARGPRRRRRAARRHRRRRAARRPTTATRCGCVVPKRYFWKSAKWIRGLQFLPQDQLGFWERYGYNNNADPWKEERFTD